MIAKQKADELIEKVKKATTYKYQEYSGANYSTFEHDIEELKSVALIMVDEILHCEATEPADTDWDDCSGDAQYYWAQKKIDAGKFWEDVKSELNAL